MDRCSIEIFANDGSLTMCYAFVPKRFPGEITLQALEGTVTIDRLSLHDVASIWKAD